MRISELEENFRISSMKIVEINYKNFATRSDDHDFVLKDIWSQYQAAKEAGNILDISGEIAGLYTPLQLAEEANNQEIITKFKSALQKLEVLKVIEAIHQGKRDVVESFTEENSYWHSVKHLGKSLLHIAVRDANIDIVQLLIAKGADVNIRDRESCTPLQIAMTIAESPKEGIPQGENEIEQRIDKLNLIIDLLLKNMTLSDIKEQYYAIEDSGYAAEDRFRDYISTCRELEMTIRKEARKDPLILSLLADKLPKESLLKKEIKDFLESSQKDHEGPTLGNIVKKIVDAFREMFGIDELSKLVREIKNEPVARSKAEEVIKNREKLASQSQVIEA